MAANTQNSDQKAAVSYAKDNDGIATLTLDMPGRSTNVLNDELATPFLELLGRIEADESVKGIILTSGKDTFLVGADIDKLFAITEAADAIRMADDYKALLRRLETIGKPVVCAINGTALGGGLELALACHYRVAIDKPGLKIGFPEVQLGLLPGGGGTQRLPRLIGIQASLPYLLEGKELTPAKAREKGIVQEVAENGQDLLARARTWILSEPEASQPWDRKKFRFPGGDAKHPAVAQMWGVAPNMLAQKTHGNFPAPVNILSCVFEGGLVDFDTGCMIESRYFAHCVVSAEARNMITALWYQLNQIKRGESRPQGIETTKVKRLGVLGAGMMGAGIAYVSARAGMQVVLKDVSAEAAEKGRSHAEKLLAKAVQRGKMSEEKKQDILNRIQPTGSAEDTADCDLIIEAVFEDRDLKGKVTQETEAAIADTTVFASNTSTLPITGLAKASSRPHNFIGLHFFSPVDKMPLVEIIVGEQTSEETLARGFDYVQQIGKTPVVVNDSRGFYTSRVFSTYVMEGITLLEEGHNPHAIEQAGLKAGMPVGPLALNDEVSLSLSLHIMNQTRKDFEAEGKTYTPHPAEAVVYKMVEELDRPGKKAGKGFYDYPEGGKKHLWPGLAEQFPEAALPLDQDAMIERMMFVQANETAKCFQEKVVTKVPDANIGSIFGWGFAPFKGGTLQYINDYGVQAFVDRSRELAARHGERFEPADVLVKMAAAGESFTA